MSNTYILWDRSELYTNFGIAETWLLKREYEELGYCNKDVNFPGMYDCQDYSDRPVGFRYLTEPSSKVIAIKYQQNGAQESSVLFFNPIHLFCKTDGKLVRAKDLKVGDMIVSLSTEYRITYVEIFDRKESRWFIMETEGSSPNIFVNMLLSWPVDLKDLEEYELSFLEKKINDIEFQGYGELIPSGVGSDPMTFDVPEEVIESVRG